MMIKAGLKLVAMATLVSMAGCERDTTTQDPAPSPATVTDTSDLDLFSLVIEAERWGVMVDNANSGAFAMAMDGPRIERSDHYRLDYALRDGVRRLFALRDSLCVDGLEPDISCTPLAAPDWFLAPPLDPASVPLGEYAARSAWLGEQVQPYVEVGCDAGRSATGDERFCAVE